MDTLDDVFELWETIPKMADDLGENSWTVSKWKQRGRIPSDYWGAVIQAARRKGKKLTTDDLLVVHAPTKKAGGSLACR